MRITHSTRSASARGKLLRCTRAIRASPSSAVNVRWSSGFCTMPPVRLSSTWSGHQGSEETGVTAAYALVKPSVIKPSVGDDGVRGALYGWGLQARTALAQGHRAAAASL